MPELDICPECRTPRHITSQHVWLDNGVIGAKRDDRQRLVFFECGSLDPLFNGISDLIGMPIERMVIDASRRSTKEYMDRIVPDDIKETIRSGEVDLRLITDSTFLIWRAMGYGKLVLSDLRYRDDDGDFITVRFEKPYSLPLSLGNFAGSIEAITGREPGIRFEEVSPDVYEVTIFRAENPPELKRRLRWKGYEMEYKSGDIHLEKCPSCGGPAALSEFHWDQGAGSIRSTVTGRRMVMTGPSMIDPIFDELEAELGDSVPRVVVEAQREFAKSGFIAVEEVVSEENMRELLALRGLGNLRELKMGPKGVSLYLENAALPLLGVGLTQGLFENAFGKNSRAEWEISEGGGLQVEVTPVA